MPQPTTIAHTQVAGVGGTSSVGDKFGASASGDIDNDDFDDVIIGVPGVTDAGVESAVL